MTRVIQSRAKPSPYQASVHHPAPNPIMCREGRGARNFSCLHYDRCLDKAAKGMWSGFTCHECPFFQGRDEPS
ncbi:MAG: hypothetical protein SWC40_09580 [Thermodesulfobacteriota bacterium]|nr:hypothetical protein [Thermodesulfobacteriota bacterium]